MNTTLAIIGMMLLAALAAVASIGMANSEKKARQKRRNEWYSVHPHHKRYYERG